MTPKDGAAHLQAVGEYRVVRHEVHAPEAWQADLARFRSFQAATHPRSSIKLRDYHLRRFARWVNLPPYEVTWQLMLEHLDNPRWSQNTRRSVRTTLAAFYRWAYLTEATPTNLAERLPGIPFNAGKPRPAADEAVAAALASAPPRVNLMIRLGALAGLRCCEIARVSTDDLERGPDGWSLNVVGKGGKHRVVPISAELAIDIRAAGPGFIFPGAIDGHLSASYVSKLISRELPPGETAHKLRHRFASRAYRGSGNNIRAVQELLGHASVATTQIYTAVDSDELRRAAAAAA